MGAYILIEVKNTTSDESVEKLNLRYLPRRLEVKARFNFSTPVRSITDRDYENNRNSASRLKLHDSVSNLTLYYGLDEITSLLQVNGYLKELNQRVVNFIRPALNSPVRLLALRIDPAAYRLFSLKSNVERFVRFVTYVQSTLGTVSLPYFVTDSVKIEELYDEFTKSFENPVIWLSLAEDSKIFEKRVNHIRTLIKEGRLNLVGVHYSDYLAWNVNYDQFYDSIHDLDALVALEGVERKDSSDNLSKLHIFPFASFDAVSPLKKHTNSKSRWRFKFDKPSGNFLIRKDVTLQHFKDIQDKEAAFREYKNSPVYDLVSEMNDFNPKTVDQGDPVIKRKLRQFNSFSYVHQAVEGGLEMSLISDSIQKRESIDYLASKTMLDDKVKQMFPKNKK